MKVKQYILIFLAVTGISSAIYASKRSSVPPPPPSPMSKPAANPFQHAVAASGIIEASKENVAIGTPVPGIIEKVYVHVYEPVKAGTPLFAIDGRDLQAELLVKKAHAEVVKAELLKVEDQLSRLKSINDPRAVSQEDVRTKEHEVTVAKNNLNYTLAEIAHTETLLERLVVKAPRDGVVMQNNAREGEYLSLNASQPAMILGDTTQLQIRADIDEQNAAQVIPNAQAVAYPKNRPDKPISLNFVRIEPYVIPKKSLTGLSDERVDTRVLQVIYNFTPPKDFTVYVGQQVDVFIEATPNNL